MTKVALVVRLKAKAGKEKVVAEFLAGALPLAQGEAFTPVWFALAAPDGVFYIFDAFANDADRTQHLQGQIAAALMKNAPDLLAEPPMIDKVDVLASKVTG